jgi:hypothetical protein
VTLKFNRSEPGVWVSAAAHATMLATGLFAFVGQKFPEAYPEAQEGIPVEIVTENEFAEIIRAEQSAKQVQPQLKPRIDRAAEKAEERDSGEASPYAPALPTHPLEAKVDDKPGEAAPHSQPTLAPSRWHPPAVAQVQAPRSKQPASASINLSPRTKVQDIAESQANQPSASSSSKQPTNSLSYDWEPAREGQGFRYLPANQFRMNAKFVQPMFKLDLNSIAADKTRDLTFDDADFSFLQRDARERNQVTDFKLILSAPNDALKLTLREADSLNIADVDILRKNRWRPSDNTGRFYDLSGAQGRANHQRLDISLYKSDLFEVSAFAAHTHVDQNFERSALLPKPESGKKDEFSAVDRTAVLTGGNLRIGPVTVSTSHTEAEKISGVLNPTSAIQDYTVTLDLTDLRKRLGNVVAEPLWTILPTSVYGGYGDTKNAFKLPEQGLPDQTSTYTLGASWAWKNGYASLNYYQYELDSRRLAAASYDSAGSGLSGNVGIWGDNWTADAGVSYLRSEELAPFSRAKSTSYDGYISATYKPERLPDVSALASVGRYGYEGLASAVRTEGTYWSVTAGLEFAKFLWHIPGPKVETQTSHDGRGTKASFALKGPASERSSFKMIYRVRGEHNDGTDGGASRTDQLVGVVFRTLF